MMRDENINNPISCLKLDTCNLTPHTDDNNNTLLQPQLHRKTFKRSNLNRQTALFSGESRAEFPKIKKVSFSEVEGQHFKQSVEQEHTENNESPELLYLLHLKKRPTRKNTCHIARRTCAPFPDSLIHDISTLLYNASLMGFYSRDDTNSPVSIHNDNADNDAFTGNEKLRNNHKDDENANQYTSVGTSVSLLLHDGKRFRLTSRKGSKILFETSADAVAFKCIERSQDMAKECTTNDTSLASCNTALVEDSDGTMRMSKGQNHEAEYSRNHLLTNRIGSNTYCQKEDYSNSSDELSCSSALTSASLYHGASKGRSHCLCSTFGASEEHALHCRRRSKDVPFEIILSQRKESRRNWKGI